MNKRTVYKVPDGKLIKIKADIDNESNKITRINISGDFFAYPEESISELELILQQTHLNREDLSDVINNYITTHQVQFIGLNADSLTEAILRCEE